MSEVSGGPGWWLASDDKWYPPESRPAEPQGPRQQGSYQQPGGGPPAYQQAYPPYAPYQPVPGYGAPASAATNGLAVAALICGILWGFGVLSILAIVFGAIAKRQISRTNERGSGMALAGIILGGVGIVGAIVSVVVLVAVGTYVDEELNSAARVAVVAPQDVCWTIAISNFDSDLNRLNEGCGPAVFDLGRGLGRSAVVTKTSGSGPVVATLTVDGETRERETTRGDYGSVELSP